MPCEEVGVSGAAVCSELIDEGDEGTHFEIAFEAFVPGRVCVRVCVCVCVFKR